MRRIATAGSLALLAMMFLLHPGQARAATSCSASVGGISFGTVDPSGTTDVSAVVTLSCDSSGLQVLGTVYVNACLLLGTGSGGSSLSPRTLRNGFGDTIEYNVYRGSGYVNVWGNTPATWLPLQLSIPVILLGGSGSTSATVQARIPSQPGLAAGTYSSSFDGIHTELRYRYDEPLVLIGSSMPASCESGGDGGATGIPFAMFTVTASVADQCVISTATDLDFGPAACAGCGWAAPPATWPTSSTATRAGPSAGAGPSAPTPPPGPAKALPRRSPCTAASRPRRRCRPASTRTWSG